MLVQVRNRFPFIAKLLVPQVATRIWVHVYMDPFEYPEEDPSVGGIFYLGIKSLNRLSRTVQTAVNIESLYLPNNQLYSSF
ncbi:hypothetical protein YC2023_066866 [Brassica napus]